MNSNWKSLQAAFGNARGFGSAYLLVFLVIIFGTSALYIYKASRQR